MAVQTLNIAAPTLRPPPAEALRNTSLLLDFDGTLVDIVDRPDAVVVDHALVALLTRLTAEMPGRVAVVSGRSIDQIEDFLGAAADGIAIGGSHGAERQSADGTRIAPERPAALARVAAAFERFAQDDPGVLIEDKALGVALHYRLAPHHEADAVTLATREAAREGLVVQHGKMMVEVRVAGDKGAAIHAILAAEPAMQGTRPIFFGDDLTDEAGFAAAAALGGAGVLVGAPRATEAQYGVPDVAAVRAWLMNLVETA